MARVIQPSVSYSSVAAKKDSGERIDGETKDEPAGISSQNPWYPKPKLDYPAAQLRSPKDLRVAVNDQADSNGFNREDHWPPIDGKVW